MVVHGPFNGPSTKHSTRAMRTRADFGSKIRQSPGSGRCLRRRLLADPNALTCGFRALGGGSGGGASGTQCGGPGEPCCAGNSCNGGGCCIATTTGAQTTRLCVGGGQACVAAGVSGTCNNGSCNGPTGTPCGALGQACCGANPNAAAAFCTASGSRCAAGTCTACGGSGQACCQGPMASSCQSSLLCLTV